MRAAAIAALLSLTFAAAHAADPAGRYPDRPIRIMGQGPGSTADYLSRFLGQRLSEKWGQPVVVDNRAGAGGTIPTDMVAKAAPDGYTLVMGHAGPFVSAVSLYPNLPYDPVKDFAPVSLVSRGVTILVTHPSVPANSVQELIAYAKQKGGLSFGSAGNGTISHLSGELFNQLTGVKILHIPYKSAGFALTALLSAETQVAYLSPITAHAQLKAGKVKALTVSSRNRFAGAPEVPGAGESGVPNFEALLWFGIFTTGKTPRTVVMKINESVVEILSRTDVKETILKQGAEVWPSTPEELGAFVKNEVTRWTPIIKAAGIKAD